jgi:hypothetical protein
VLQSLSIKPDDFVVEVGGGHQPFWRSDVIFNKYPFDNAHRSQDLVHSAPVLIAYATELPLPDKGCDVIFASHIIEHLPAPDQFLAEVQRCSDRIYLEFPSMTRELMFAWSFHEWVVTVEGSHLTFYREDIPQLFADFFHRHYDFLFDAWNIQRHGELNSWIYCSSADLTWEFAPEGAFQRALASSRSGQTKVNAAACERVEYTWRQIGTLIVQKLLPEPALGRLVAATRRRRRGTGKPLTQALIDRLACRKCNGGRLLLDDREIRCLSCDAAYGRRQGLFDLDTSAGGSGWLPSSLQGHPQRN